MFIFVLKMEIYDNLEFKLEFRFLEWHVISFKYADIYFYMNMHEYFCEYMVICVVFIHSTYYCIS